MIAQELRIGNIIKDDRKAKEWRFVTHRIISDLASNPGVDLYHAIPLTEEWLLKFGFNKRSMHGYDRHFEYHHHKLRSPITALHNADFSMQLDQCARGVNHVHRLQNLFFDITGEELTIIE